MKTIFAKPAEGLQVRKEDDPRLHVNPEGELLPASTYYRRRVRAGDLVETKASKPSGRKTAAKANTEA